jgi:hypothetical protein
MKVRVLSVPSLLCAALAAQQPIAVEGALKTIAAGDRSAPVSPPSETVTLTKTAPGGVTAPADCAEPLFGQQTLGGKRVTFVVGKSKAGAEQIDELFADLDGDGKLTAAEKVALNVAPLPARGNGPSPGVRSEPAELTFKLGGGAMLARATFFRMSDNASLNLVFPTYLEAKVKIGDAERVIAVIDKNLDGRFDSADDLWAIAGKAPVSAYGMNALGERSFEDNQLIGIKLEKNNVVEVTVTPAKGPDPKDMAAHRERVEHIWFERFDKERSDFIKAQEVDTKRPRAKDPIHWNYVSFDEAIAMGKKANKPVFIDVMAFWCVWCYRMDYYTYPDQEVAEVLNTKYVPCKIIQEQAAPGEYDKMMKEKLNAKGIPAMGVFDADGNLVHQIGGWKKPEGDKGFLAELTKGLEAKAGDAAAKKEKDGGKK